MEGIISFVVFIILLGFFLYEFYLWIKEKKSHEKPVIPEFQPGEIQNKIPSVIVTVHKKDDSIKKKGSFHFILVIILFVLLMLFGFLTIYLSKTKKVITNTEKNVPQLVVSEINSKGIRIFTKDWMEILSTDSARIKNEQRIVIGIETIEGADIDMARIKVNKTIWEPIDITNLFNNEKKVYYKEYTLASGESKLQIDAQLHSISDQWLGD